jgi:hypothetical protein
VSGREPSGADGADERVMKLPTEKIAEFVDVMKDVVLDKHGKIATTPQFTDEPRRRTQRLPNGAALEYGPRSLPNVTDWTEQFLFDNGV